jgi:predicted neuraminidase
MASCADPLGVDVLVVGGGMAGVFAALGAARDGLSVTLLEPTNVLGGQGTAGGVAGFCGDTARVNRPFSELICLLSQQDLVAPLDPLTDRRAYDLETCAFFLQELVLSRGIDLRLHARAISAAATDGRVTRVVATCDSDQLIFAPGMVIDATGNCVVPVASGFAIQHQGPLAQLPMSLYFTLWDSGSAVRPFLPAHCPSWESDDDLPMTTLHTFPSGKVEVKMKVIGFDAAAGDSLSRAEVTARRQMMGLIHHLQTRGYRGTVLDRHVLASVSRVVGQREGRRIVGEHVLTEEEVTHACIFHDAVAVGTYHLDYHWPDKVERAGTGITTMVEPYHIPLRSLIARGGRNLLVPGRGAAGDQLAMSSFRVMATCAQTGFAAGTAAAACLHGRTDLRSPPVAAIQQLLEEDGQALDLSAYGEYLRPHIHVHEHLFEGGPCSPCHASSLVLLDNGCILVAWFGGTREGADDVAIWTALRSQGRWSPPRRVAKVRAHAHWNPVLLRAPDGRIHLYFKVGQRIPEWETWTCVSADGGSTWSSPRELVYGDRGGRGPVKNKPIILANGDWLAGASLQADGVWDVFVDRSVDGGGSWQAGRRLELDHDQFSGAGVIQPTLWESAPGQVHMLMRSTGGRICRSDSGDGGHSWSPVRPTRLPSNNSGIDLARLDDGRLALVCNPTSAPRRTPLAVLLSVDNGETWARRLDLETEDGEYSYPAIIPTRVGMAVAYTWKRQRIAIWLGSVERLTEWAGGSDAAETDRSV